METTNLIIRDSTNFPILSEHVAGLLDSLKAKENELTEAREAIRTALLQAMIDNNVICGQVGIWNITQVIPKDIVNFDTDAFVANEPDQFVEAFVKNIDETETVDLKKLAHEFPEAYKACVQVDTHVTVDTEKLAKHFNNIYEKYVSIRKSDKPITLRISETRKKSKETNNEI